MQRIKKIKSSQLLSLLLTLAMVLGTLTGMTISASAADVPFTPFSKEELSNVKLNDVVLAFNQVSTYGTKTREPSAKGFSDSMIKNFKSHIQGLGIYGKYTIINVNGDGEPAKIFIFDENGLMQTLTLPGGSKEHTSGMQVCGSVLAILVGDGSSGAQVMFVDLRPLDDGGMVNFLPGQAITMDNGMAIGMTNYTDKNGVEKLLIINTNNLAIESPIPEDGYSFQWTRRPFAGATCSSQNMALVTDTNNQVYMIAFNSVESQQGSVADIINDPGFGGLNFDDSMTLYALDVHGDTIQSTFVKQKDVTSFDDQLLVLGARFRYGATLNITDPNCFTVYSSRRLPGNAHFELMGAGGAAAISALFGGNTMPIVSYKPTTAYLLNNKSGTVAKLDVSYTLDGKRERHSTNATPAAQTGVVEIPSMATDITVEVYAHTGTKWKLFKTFQYGAAMGDARRYSITGTIFNPEITEGMVLGADIQYQLDIKTDGDMSAGTDSDIFVRLVGEKGTTNEVRLNYGVVGQFGVNINPFEMNGYDSGVFEFDKDVGKITAVQVRSDMSGPGPDWHLKKIKVIPRYNTTTPSTVEVMADEWIVNKDWHTYYVDSSASTQYKLTVKTSDVANAGTDSNIYVKLVGEDGSVTAEKELTSLYSGNAFERNTVHSVVVNFDRSVGDVKKIIVRSDMSGAGPDWHVDSIIAQHTFNGNVTGVTQSFPIKSLIADTASHTYSNDPNDSAQYRLAVKTGSGTSAGTDSNIYVKLVGSKGTTEERELSELYSGNAFEANTTHTVTAAFDKNIGEVQQIMVRSNMSGAGPDWLLDSITVQPVFGDNGQGNATTFNIKQWITNSNWRTYSNNPNDSSQYRLTVKTGSGTGAGTDSDIFVKLVGSKGTTEERELSELYSGNAFEANTAHAVTATFDKNVGEVKQILVRSDMSGAGADWLLDSVSVQPVFDGNPQSGAVTFNIKQWITNGNWRTFSNDANAITQYRITIRTGKLHSWISKGEGTDANIYVRLVGENGSTNEVKLNDLIGGNAFERGNTDVCNVTFDNAVGNLWAIQLRSDMAWAGADWYLNNIEVQPLINGSNTGGASVFYFNTWVNSKNIYQR